MRKVSVESGTCHLSAGAPAAGPARAGPPGSRAWRPHVSAVGGMPRPQPGRCCLGQGQGGGAGPGAGIGQVAVSSGRVRGSPQAASDKSAKAVRFVSMTLNFMLNFLTGPQAQMSGRG